MIKIWSHKKSQSAQFTGDYRRQINLSSWTVSLGKPVCILQSAGRTDGGEKTAICKSTPHYFSSTPYLGLLIFFTSQCRANLWSYFSLVRHQGREMCRCASPTSNLKNPHLKHPCFTSRDAARNYPSLLGTSPTHKPTTVLEGILPTGVTGPDL